MDTLELKIVAAARRASRWFAAGMLCTGAAACAGLEPKDEPGGDVDRLAERLVQTARERADLRQIRVWVTEIRETRAQTTRASAQETPDDLIGLRLEHELVIALATRLNVVESELVEPALASESRAALGETAAARGATHVLVGDYVRQRDALQITLRLVDAETRLIVAAARGEVKLSEVGLMGFDRWAKNATDSGPLAVPGTELGKVASQPGNAEPSEPAGAAPATAGAVAPESTLRPPTAATVKATQSTLRPPGTTTARPTQSTLRPPGTTSPKATQAALRPAGTEPAPPETAVAPSPGSRAWPVEDFETWRERRVAEGAIDASQTVEELDQAARASTDAAVRARRNELADRDEEAAQPFPWRQNPWLGRLLGVPETPPTGKR